MVLVVPIFYISRACRPHNWHRWSHDFFLSFAIAVPLRRISFPTSSYSRRTRPIHIEWVPKICQMCLVDPGAIPPLPTLPLRLEIAGASTHKRVVGTHRVPLPERVARRGLIPIAHRREVGDAVVFVWMQSPGGVPGQPAVLLRSGATRRLEEIQNGNT